MNLIHLQTRIFDTPLAIQPAKLEVILQAIGPRLGLGLEGFDIEAATGRQANQQKEYSITQDGIAIVPVQGTLMKKTSGLMAMSGCTSYESLANQINECMNSPQVRGVLLDIDSPGGEVSGLFDLADAIYNARDTGKPIYAVSNDAAYSAAYAIASSADKLFVTRTAGVGSIGVFTLHVDQSAADSKAGLKFTYIKAGAKKTEGNPHEPLTDSALSDSQAEVDREYQMFVQLVARNRGVSAKSVIATEAGCYFADNAIPLLADEIGTFEDALVAITAVVNGTAQTNLINTPAARKSEGTQTMKKKAQVEDMKLAAEAVAQIAQAFEDSKAKADDYEMEAEAEAKAADTKPKDDEEDGDEDESCEPESKATSATDFKQIVNLCTLAGADLATMSSFINQGFSVQDVQKALLEQRASKSKSTKVNTTLSTMNGASNKDRLKAGVTPKTTAEEYKKFLLSNSEAYAAYLNERYTNRG